jgi:hypothetical protein
VEELHEYIDASQLTSDLSGTLPYNHDEWIQQRVVSSFEEYYYLLLVQFLYLNN